MLSGVGGISKKRLIYGFAVMFDALLMSAPRSASPRGSPLWMKMTS
jgi:hypothetical protein